MTDTSVASPTELLPTLAGSLVPPSALAAARRSLIPQGNESCEQLQRQVLILLSLVHGLQSEMFSGDARWFAYSTAEAKCQALGIGHDEFWALAKKANELGRRAREDNPISVLF